MSSHLAVQTSGVVIAVETFDDRADPTIVLSMGANASMVWWPGDHRRYRQRVQ